MKTQHDYLKSLNSREIYEVFDTEMAAVKSGRIRGFVISANPELYNKCAEAILAYKRAEEEKKLVGIIRGALYHLRSIQRTFLLNRIEKEFKPAISRLMLHPDCGECSDDNPKKFEPVLKKLWNTAVCRYEEELRKELAVNDVENLNIERMASVYNLVLDMFGEVFKIFEDRTKFRKTREAEERRKLAEEEKKRRAEEARQREEEKKRRAEEERQKLIAERASISVEDLLC